MIDQQWDIILALVQGRHMEHNHAEPVVKVFPEIALGNLFLQIFVRGCDYPDVHLDVLVASHARKLLFLEHPEDLCLGGKAHVSDLVEEESAAVGLLEFALVLLYG